MISRPKETGKVTGLGARGAYLTDSRRTFTEVSGIGYAPKGGGGSPATAEG